MKSQQDTQYSELAKKNWAIRHLNWTYGIVLLVGLIIGTYLALIGHPLAGFITYTLIVIVTIPAIFAMKGWTKIPWWIIVLFIFSNGLGFPIAILCLKNKSNGT
jgi:hypothetical protein